MEFHIVAKIIKKQNMSIKEGQDFQLLIEHKPANIKRWC